MKVIKKAVSIIIVVITLFLFAGCATNVKEKEKEPDDYYKSLMIHTYYIDVTDDSAEYYGAVSGKDQVFATYTYEISDGILYISPWYNYEPGTGTEKPEKVNIKIQDEKIRTVSKVIIGDRSNEHEQIIWDRENGFRGTNGTYGMGLYQNPRYITSYIFNVKNDCVEYGGFLLSGAIGFSGYSYTISEDTLYICPEVTFGDRFYITNDLHIIIQDRKIRDIKTIIVGRADDNNREIVWDRESGFIGSEYAKVYWTSDAWVEPYLK